MENKKKIKWDRGVIWIKVNGGPRKGKSERKMKENCKRKTRKEFFKEKKDQGKKPLKVNN